jgi:hypothetical protein
MNASAAVPGVPMLLPLLDRCHQQSMQIMHEPAAGAIAGAEFEQRDFKGMLLSW